MAAIIIVNSDYPLLAEILTDSVGMNMIFQTWQEADSWLESNAEAGIAYRILDCKDWRRQVAGEL